MSLYEEWKAILRIQKFRRIVSYSGFYCFAAVLSYAYTSNTTRAGIPRVDQFYATYPAGTELLTDTAKLYKAALGNCFELEEWGPIEYSIMSKHFERQGKPPYAYHSGTFGNINLLMSKWSTRKGALYLVSKGGAPFFFFETWSIVGDAEKELKYSIWLAYLGINTWHTSFLMDSLMEMAE